MHVSSEYITSRVLLSLTSTACRTLRVLLADVIPWINKASLALYIARKLCAMPRPTQCSEAVCNIMRCRGRLLWLKIVSVEVESRSQTPSLWLRCRYQRGLDCAHTILMTFYHNMNHHSMQLLGMWLSFHIHVYIAENFWGVQFSQIFTIKFHWHMIMLIIQCNSTYFGDLIFILCLFTVTNIAKHV